MISAPVHGRDTGVLVATLRERTLATLRPMLAGARRCALVDFPDHLNVGDSAIWLGAVAVLRHLGVEIRYRCDTRLYDPVHLRRALGDGIIVINGGGNFGDVWKRHQRLRETVIQDFPDVPIVQLPQTIHFRERETLEAARRILDAHPRLTLVVRDQKSLEFARTQFQATSVLCPDMAFSLGPLQRPLPSRADLLWLRRIDEESARQQAGSAPPAAIVCDWLDGPLPRWRRARVKLHGWNSSGLLNRAVAAAYEGQAGSRLDAGCRLLAQGRVVVTDRLHAHILCLLLDIPHVILDNSYGKLRRVVDTWTAGAPRFRWAESPADAWGVAAELLAEVPPHTAETREARLRRAAEGE